MVPLCTLPLCTDSPGPRMSGMSHGMLHRVCTRDSYFVLPNEIFAISRESWEPHCSVFTFSFQLTVKTHRSYFQSWRKPLLRHCVFKSTWWPVWVGFIGMYTSSNHFISAIMLGIRLCIGNVIWNCWIIVTNTIKCLKEHKEYSYFLNK